MGRRVVSGMMVRTPLPYISLHAERATFFVVVLCMMWTDSGVGETEVDDEEDFWADHDERCHGTIDTAEMRKDYPEGFRWSCCDELGDQEGCQVTPHHPDRTKRVRK